MIAAWLRRTHHRTKSHSRSSSRQILSSLTECKYLKALKALKFSAWLHSDMLAINCKSHKLIAPHTQWAVCHKDERIYSYQQAWQIHVVLLTSFCSTGMQKAGSVADSVCQVKRHSQLSSNTLLKRYRYPLANLRTCLHSCVLSWLPLLRMEN